MVARVSLYHLSKPSKIVMELNLPNKAVPACAVLESSCLRILIPPNIMYGGIRKYNNILIWLWINTYTYHF